MLVSHLKRFIYLKTKKTAGTSIEIYFEPYCVEAVAYAGARHATAAAISDSGTVGARGPDERHPIWHKHMQTTRTRELLRAQHWRSYFKFCAIRNPFDKVVSHFWFALPEYVRAASSVAPFEEVRSAFGFWLESARLPVDYQVYCLAGAPAVDAFVRYEQLAADLEHVCRRLNVPWERERLGRYKS